MSAVETYEVGELTENGVSEYADPIAAERFVTLAREMGLVGQSGLVGAVRPSAHAFRPMSAVEQFTFGALFPTKTPVEKYAGEPMPLRVLEVLKKAREAGQFKRFEVWSPEVGTTIKDPVLVGIGTGRWDFEEIPHPVARWGDALEEFSALVKRAGAMVKSRAIAAIRRIQTQAAADLAALDATPAEDVASVLTLRTPSYTSPTRDDAAGPF